MNDFVIPILIICIDILYAEYWSEDQLYKRVQGERRCYLDYTNNGLTNAVTGRFLLDVSVNAKSQFNNGFCPAFHALLGPDGRPPSGQGVEILLE